MATHQHDPEISGELLAYLQGALSEPALRYAEPPEPLTGGYDTAVYAFRLTGTKGAFDRPLVFRVFPEMSRSSEARLESAVQNAAADGGYPAPRVLVTEPDGGIVGRPFTIMERMRGSTLRVELEGSLLAIPRCVRQLAEAQARLHALDPEPLARALADFGLPPALLTFDAWLGFTGLRIDRSDLSPLRPGFEWLRAQRPPEPERLAICHCDFHVNNVLIEGDTLTGVVDWANTRIADPALDVGASIVALTMGPTELPQPVARAISPLRRYLGRRYLSAYRRYRLIAEHKVQYYAAFRCFAAISHALEGDRPGYAWGAPKVFADLRSYFARISGIKLRVAL